MGRRSAASPERFFQCGEVDTGLPSLVAYNTGEFHRVAGLRVEDWTG